MSFRPALITRNVLKFLWHHSGEQRRMIIQVIAGIGALFFIDFVVLGPVLVLGIDFVAVNRFVPVFAAEMADDNGGFLLVFDVLIWRRRELESGVHVLAVRSVGAETGNVVRAQHSADVAVPAVGPVSAEPAVVPRTVFYFAFGVYVEKGALFIVTSVETGVEIALWHFGHVVFVQKLALIAFFAQAS